MKKTLIVNPLTRAGLLVVLMVVSQLSYGQSSDDFMRSTGKIYVVAAVTLVILIGIFLYLIYLEKKISRIEKQHNNE